jgi:hypothetical protein
MKASYSHDTGKLGTGDTGNSVALELKTMRFDSSLATITN